MANLSWDWWFVDVPPKKFFSRTRVNRWLRSVGMRRWLLSVSIAGAGSLASFGPAMAGNPAEQIVVTPASFGWADPSPMAVLLAPQEETDSSKNDQTGELKLDAAVVDDAPDGDAPDDDAPVDDAPVDADEQRRQRLRELLRDDDDVGAGKKDKSDAGESNDDADDSDKSDDLFAEPFIAERLPEVAGGRFILPPLRAVSIAQEPIGNGRVPEALNAGDELTLVPLPEDAMARSALTSSAGWPALVRPWAAPNTYSHPLYFDDRMLERHGHERWGCLQPIASGARFFATVPMLPYLTTITSPCETVYSKGYFRSGSAVPRFYQRPPLERRAVIVQSAATAAGFIALP